MNASQTKLNCLRERVEGVAATGAAKRKDAGTIAGFLFAGLILALALIPAPAPAQTLQDALRQQLQQNRQMGERKPMDREARAIQSEMSRLSRDPEQSKSRYLATFYQIAPDGELTREAVELNRKQQQARNRASQIMEFLQLDLDGDAKISAEEFAIGPQRNNSRGRAQAEMLRLTGDLDGDGYVNAPEMMEFARKQSTSRNGFDRFSNPMLEVMMGFDQNDDGKVTSDEVLAGIDAMTATGTKRP